MADLALRPAEMLRISAGFDPAALAKSVDAVLAHYRRVRGQLEPTHECLKLVRGELPAEVRAVMATLPPEWEDHAIASVHAVLMPHEHRKKLGAYFTPPHLVEHLLRRMAWLGMNPLRHTLRDPGAGGAAFLVPLARQVAEGWRAQGMSPSEIVASLPEHLTGIEIEPGLAEVANALLRRMLVREHDFPRELVADLQVVRVGDALATDRTCRGAQHEIGNPPYRRLSAREHAGMRPRFHDIAAGRLNLYALFMRWALDEIPPGGLVGHIVPSSFLGGPEFSAFRRRIMQLAEVLVVDLVHQRRDVFLDVTQDTCFVVMRKRDQEVVTPGSACAASGTFSRDGIFAEEDTVTLASDGSPWRLSCTPLQSGGRLADWGYAARVGYLVANRQPERLHNCPGEGRYPLVWAKAVTPEGTFDHERGSAHKGHGWASAPPDANYVVRKPCVVVQRTSSRGQHRRVNAAAVPSSFIGRHGGIIGENHVLLLVPTRADALPPEELAAALNDPRASMDLNRVCGSASIPARVLESLRLPRMGR
jgi:adenine-specific DNA-methyltransferase